MNYPWHNVTELLIIIFDFMRQHLLPRELLNYEKTLGLSAPRLRHGGIGTRHGYG